MIDEAFAEVAGFPAVGGQHMRPGFRGSERSLVEWDAVLVGVQTGEQGGTTRRTQ